jgi:hypothetical protein
MEEMTVCQLVLSCPRWMSSGCHARTAHFRVRAFRTSLQLR